MFSIPEGTGEYPASRMKARFYMCRFFGYEIAYESENEKFPLRIPIIRGIILSSLRWDLVDVLRDLW